MMEVYPNDTPQHIKLAILKAEIKVRDAVIELINTYPSVNPKEDIDLTKQTIINTNFAISESITHFELTIEPEIEPDYEAQYQPPENVIKKHEFN